MNLVWFLIIMTFLISWLGEFGRYPFAASNAISLLDLSVGLSLLCGLIWQVGIKRRLKLFPSSGWLIGFLLVAIISLVVSLNLSGGLYLVRFSCYAALSWLGYQLILSKQVSLIKLLHLLLMSVVVTSIIGLGQLLLFPDFSILTNFGYDPHQFRLSGSLLDPNFIGVVINIGLFIAGYLWFKKPKSIYLWLVGLLTLCLILTFSRSAYLMAVVMLIPFLFKLSWRWLLVLILISLIIFSIPRVNQRIIGGFQVDASASQRFSSWQSGLTAFQQHPLLGVGFNNWRQYYLSNNLQQVYSDDGGHAGNGIDSSLVFVLATTGFSGLLLYFGWWSRLAWLLVSKPQKRIYLGLIAGLLVNSQFINSLFFPTIMLYYFLLFGALLYDDGVGVGDGSGL